ncbi:MAG: hypothetical protein ACC645_27030, partial [Pirellulales bacterium]
RIGGTGGLAIRDGRDFVAPGALTNYGIVEVGDGSRLTVPAGHTYTQADGSTTVNGILDAPGGVFIDDGAFGGVGTINADVTNAGSMAPGSSPGILDILGDYTQTPDGTLLLEMAGRDPSIPHFDRLRVTGIATLDGTVRGELLGGFQPTPGDAFRVLTAALVSGQFATHDLPAPGGVNRRLNPIYDATSLTFQTQVVPPLDFLYATTGAASDGHLSPQEVVLDVAGNAYVTGAFRGTVDFDREHSVAGDTLSSTNGDGFLAKYDSAGQLLWVKLIDGTSDTYGSGLAIQHGEDPVPNDARIYVSGPFNGSVRYDGGTPISGTGGQESFLLKIHPDGSQLELAPPTSTGSAFARRLAMAPSGNVLVAGQFSGTADMDPGGDTTTISSNAGSLDAFVLEVTPTFGFVRTGRLGGSGTDQGRDLVVDAAGDVWLAGEFAGTTSGLASLTAAGDPADAKSDVFLLKLDPSGTTFAASVTRSYGGPGNDTGNAVTITPAGEVVLGGDFEFSVDFDVDPDRAFTLHSSGDRDYFLLKLAADGRFEWARAVGGYRDDRLFDDIERARLAGGPSDNLLDASAFPGPVVLIGSAGNDTLIG